MKTPLNEVRLGGAALALGLLMLTGAPVGASTIYIGDDAAFGKNLPTADRADSLNSLTYIFPEVSFTAPTKGSVTLTEVNFRTAGAGNVTPFVALYDGGDTSQGASYTLLSVGDAIAAAASTLVNAAFSVGGSSPVLSVATGDVLVAGAFQDARVIVGDLDAPTVPDPCCDWIERGNAIPALGQTFGGAGAADFFFVNTSYRYNIGLTFVDEPATLGLLGLGLLAAGGAARRRRRPRPA